MPLIPLLWPNCRRRNGQFTTAYSLQHLNHIGANKLVYVSPPFPLTAVTCANDTKARRRVFKPSDKILGFFLL